MIVSTYLEAFQGYQAKFVNHSLFGGLQLFVKRISIRQNIAVNKYILRTETNTDVIFFY